MACCGTGDKCIIVSIMCQIKVRTLHYFDKIQAVFKKLGGGTLFDRSVVTSYTLN